MKSEYDLYIEQLTEELILLKKELQECLDEKDYEYARHFQKGIWIIESKLRVVNSWDNHTKLDSQNLDDAIIDLNEGRIKKFSFILLPGSDFYLRFRKLSSGNLYCELPSKAELLEAEYYVYHLQVMNSKIFSLGFIPDEGSDKRMGLEFSLPKNNSCQEIKAKLAVLMFDILNIDPQSKGYLSKHF